MHAAYAFVLKTTTEYMQTPVTQFDGRDCLRVCLKLENYQIKAEL